MSDKTKGIILDLIILAIYGVFLFLFLYYGYRYIYKSRVIGTFIILLNIPICWGTLICSLLGKKTIGHRIIRKRK